MNDKIYIPSKGPDSWREFLAQPDMQWETGFSAKTMAHCWEDQNGFPKGFYKPIKDSGLNLDMLIAIPEYKVYLDNNNAPSQNDLFVLSKDSNGLAVIMIEGKVSEPFDKIIKDWNNSDGKLCRFEFLAEKLEINNNISDCNDLRYQLFHRTVSAILIAEQFIAKKAIMIVHSFSQSNEWFNDYLGFVRLLNPDINPKIDEINKCKTLSSGIDLYIGWIKGDDKYLKK
jgi:hypothetical protein